jgi:alpha-glucosidase
LLVAPIARPGVEYRHVYVPRGTWVHYWSGESVVGPAHVLVHAPLGRPAIYVRANTPVPLWPATAYDGQNPVDPLTWLVCVAPESAGSGELYEDAGDGYAFERGEFLRTRLTVTTDENVILQFGAFEGSADPRHARVELDLRGLPPPEEVRVDSTVSAAWNYVDGRLLIRLSASRQERSVQVRSSFA